MNGCHCRGDTSHTSTTVTISETAHSVRKQPMTYWKLSPSMECCHCLSSYIAPHPHMLQMHITSVQRQRSARLVEQAQVEARERGRVAGCPAAARQQLGRRPAPGQVLLKRVRARLRAQLCEQRVARREQPVRPARDVEAKLLDQPWLQTACLCAQPR